MHIHLIDTHSSICPVDMHGLPDRYVSVSIYTCPYNEYSWRQASQFSQTGRKSGMLIQQKMKQLIQTLSDM